MGVNAKETAVLQGNILVEAYKKDPASLDLNGDGKVSYVLLEGESSHQDALIRTEWSIQTLKNGGVPLEKITGAIANWDRSQASAWMEQCDGEEYAKVIFEIAAAESLGDNVQDKVALRDGKYYDCSQRAVYQQ